jgi:hypothetical protein
MDCVLTHRSMSPSGPYDSTGNTTDLLFSWLGCQIYG